MIKPPHDKRVNSGVAGGVVASQYKCRGAIVASPPPPNISRITYLSHLNL